MRGHHQIQGFTFIELMVTLAVLAILATLAAPSLVQFFDQRRLVGAGEALYSQVLFTRAEAIKRSRPMFLAISVAEDGSWAATVTDSLEIGHVPDLDYVVASGQFANRVSLDPAQVAFGFEPTRGIQVDDDGTPGTNVSQIALSLSGGQRLLVQVTPIGRVRLCTEAGNLRFSSCPFVEATP